MYSPKKQRKGISPPAQIPVPSSPKKPAPTPQTESLDRNMDEETKERAHNMDYDQPIYENMIPKSIKKP